MPKILFNTANLVGRFSNYRFKLSDWGTEEGKTIAATDDAEFARICAEIKAKGYDAVELWGAHCHPSRVSVDGAKTRRKIAADHGLTIDAIAGAYNKEGVARAEALGAKCINGGFWGTDLATVKSLINSTHVNYNYENHPEKTPGEILAKIEGGSDRIGIALDTGWLGTSADVSPVAFIRGLGHLIRHVHLKDVVTAGSHHTCKLNTGAVGIDAVINELKSLGYKGDWSWEDEPEDRNPFDIAAEMRSYIQSRI
jgi:L-ribulose-5-phosphate 3-epimerase